MRRKYLNPMSCQQNLGSALVPVGNLARCVVLVQGTGVPQGKKNPLWMGLPARLRKARKRANLSMRQCSAIAGISDTAFGNIERRGAVPGIDVIERLAAALGVPASWLAYGFDGLLPFAKKQPRPVIPYDDPEPSGRSEYRQRYNHCGERVRQVREQLGLTLRQLAERAEANGEHITHAAVQFVETGSNVPKVDTLEVIARALEISPSWLAYGEEEE